MEYVEKEIIYNKAFALKKEGKLLEALELYDNLYQILINEAREYAHGFEGTAIDEGDTRKIMPKFFEKADEYLMKDDWVCFITNNMGVIFAELGDKKMAKKYFEESIKFTRAGFDYQNPKIGLEELEYKN